MQFINKANKPSSSTIDDGISTIRSPALMAWLLVNAYAILIATRIDPPTSPPIQN
jgi:hypothetical protein